MPWNANANALYRKTKETRCTANLCGHCKLQASALISLYEMPQRFPTTKFTPLCSTTGQFVKGTAIF
jgi:hypothetical protein